MKYCKDCKHYVNETKKCTSPNLGRDFVSGEINVFFAYSIRTNSESNMCGIGATWWEPIKTSWFKRFLKFGIK